MNTEQITNAIPPELAAWLAETASSFAIIAVVVFVGFILWGAFQGYRRSIFRQVIHVAVTLAIAFIAFFCTSNVCDSIFEEFKAMSMEEVIVMLENELAVNGVILPEGTTDVLLAFDMATIGYAVAIVINTIVAPFVFAILFGVVASAGKIVTSILCFFVPKAQTRTFKLLGILGGVVEGAIIAGVVLLPLVGVVNIASDAVDVIRDDAEAGDPTATEIVEFYDEIVLPLEKHVIFQTVGSLGGDGMLESLATVEVNGEDKDLREELIIVVEIISDVSKLGETDFLNLNEADKAAILAIIDNCDESVTLSKLACGVVNGFANAIRDGVLPITIDEPFNGILMEAVDILGAEKTNPNTLGKNLTTFANIYFLLSDDGVLGTFKPVEGGAEANQSDITAALMAKDENGQTVLNKVIYELDQNENTRSLIPLVAKLTVSVIVPEGAEEVYENVKESFSELVQIETEGRTEDEVKADVSETLTNVVESFDFTVGGENGIITEEQLDEISGIVTEELMNGNLKIPVDENGEISDADLLNLLLQYGALFGQGGESEGQGE